MPSQDVETVRRVTLEALDMSRDPEPSNELESALNRVARRYGEDSIREFVRMTVMLDKSPVEAATIIYGDGAIGQQLGIAIRHIIHRAEG